MIMVAGEALFDLFVKDDVFLPVIGGSPLNVAQGLARMGQNVSFMAGISDDFLGEKLMKFIKIEKIDDHFVTRFAKPTTLSFINVNDVGVPDYAFYGQGAADRALQPLHIGDLTGVKALHIGSYSAVVEPFASTLEAVIKDKAQKIFCLYDPNIRLNVEPNHQIWRDKITALAPFLSALKMSDEDCHHLYGDMPFKDIAKPLLEAGIGFVAFTKGVDGAEIFTRDHHVTQKGRRVSVCDTVGAGDTFQAALITYLSENNALKPRNITYSHDFLTKMLEFAIHAASITCTKKGADLPLRKDLL